jgi:LCP family protein required for cell wall assembly
MKPMQDTQPIRQPTSPPARRIRRAEPKTRQPANWRRRIALIGLVLLAVMVVGAVLLLLRAAAFNDAVSTQSALSMRLFGPFSPERVNILLLGYSDETREGAYLTDSMNVLSIDRATDTTSLIALPRDLWVEGVPDVPQNMKINEAFRIGFYEDGVDYGAELASKAVTQVLGVPIDGWITLDFQGFEAMVDAVGGIKIQNPRPFKYTWYPMSFEAGNFQQRFAQGTLALDGQEALAYARARYTNKPKESSDFARSVRQQRVLISLKDRVSVWGVEDMTEALDGHLHTNLSVLDLGMLAGRIDVDRRIELGEEEAIEATTNTIGQYILVPIGRTSSSDYAPLHQFVEAELSKPPPSPSSSASPA